LARKELSALNVIEAPAKPEVAEQVRPTGLRVDHIARAFGQRQVVRDVSLHVERPTAPARPPVST